MTPREEIIWLSALLEGEGTFVLMQCGQDRKYFTVKIGVQMCDRDVIEHAARLIGGIVHTCNPKGGYRPIHSTSIYGEKARWVMRQILPYMGERRSAKIRELLAHPTAYNRTPKSWPFYEQVVASPS